jgi:hypothetical protein
LTLVGVFDTIRAKAFPAQHGVFAVYMKMTDLNGAYRFGVEIRSPDGSTVLAGAKANDDIRVNDPLVAIDFAINFPGITLPAPGRYPVTLLYNGEQAELVSLTAEHVP